MTLKKLTNIAFAAALGLGVFAFGSVDADAQGNSRWAHEKNRIKKQQKAYEKRQKAIRKAEEARYRAYRDGRYYDYDEPHDAFLPAIGRTLRRRRSPARRSAAFKAPTSRTPSRWQRRPSTSAPTGP